MIFKKSFGENKESEALCNAETTLTAWFKLNKRDKTSRNIKYVEIPRYYIYKFKSWKKRQRSQKFEVIGRLNIVSPKDNERFLLKLLLNHLKDTTSFEDIRTFNNISYQTYKEAALAMGLIKDDSLILVISEEAEDVLLPLQLRKFFAWFILAENIVSNLIWEKFKHFFFVRISKIMKKIMLYRIFKVYWKLKTNVVKI